MHLLIAFLAAIWTAMFLYQLVPVPASVDRARLERVMATEAPPALPFWRVLLIPFNSVASKLPPSLTLSVDKYLYWAQFVGKWEGWSAVEFWGLRLAVTLISFAAGLLLLGDGILAAIVAFLGYAFVGNRLSAPAKRAIREVEQALPEIASQIAMLAGTGKPLSESLRIVAEGRGMLPRWLKWVLARRPIDRPLLGSANGQPGFLREEAARSGVHSLVSFAVQLDIIQGAGVGSQLLLGSLAESIAAEYQAKIMARAEALDDTLVPVITVFYFIPYLAGLLIPIFASSILEFIR